MSKNYVAIRQVNFKDGSSRERYEVVMRVPESAQKTLGIKRLVRSIDALSYEDALVLAQPTIQEFKNLIVKAQGKSKRLVTFEINAPLDARQIEQIMATLRFEFAAYNIDPASIKISKPKS